MAVQLPKVINSLSKPARYVGRQKKVWHHQLLPLSINLLAFYHEFHSLYATHYVFSDR